MPPPPSTTTAPAWTRADIFGSKPSATMMLRFAVAQTVLTLVVRGRRTARRGSHGSPNDAPRFLKSVILRVSEARDLGEVNRDQFYDHMKALTGRACQTCQSRWPCLSACH